MEKIRNTRHPWPSIHIYIYENQICIPSRGKADGRCISHLCTLHRHPRKIHPHKQIAKKISDPFFKDTWPPRANRVSPFTKTFFPQKTQIYDDGRRGDCDFPTSERNPLSRYIYGNEMKWEKYICIKEEKIQGFGSSFRSPTTKKIRWGKNSHFSKTT